MKRVAVLTSGGDAPGMNAAVRAVVRSGIARGWAMFGVRLGYAGLLSGDLVELGPRDVGGVIQHGGTFLGSSRCVEMHTEPGLNQAVDVLESRNITGLIVIGGDGSQKGALALSRKGVEVVGVASTIDNDLPFTDVSIGTTTAIDVALEAVDRLRTTAASHQRAFLLEVMGRNSGYIGLITGIAGGAEAIVIPEVATDPETLAMELLTCHERGKHHAIVVVSEGAAFNAQMLARHFHDHHARLGFDLRVTQLGHVQRGGNPGVFDRMLATRLGAAAVDRLWAGEHGVMMGLLNGTTVSSPLSQVTSEKRVLDAELLALAKVLAD